MRRAFLLLLPALAACEPNEIAAVGVVPGVYRPGAGCVTEEAGRGACPLGAQFPFEREVDLHAFVITKSTFTNPRITCARSYCGTGSLAVDARFRWDDRRMGSLVHYLPEPVDLMNKELSFRVFVRQTRPPTSNPDFRTPINAQIAVIHNRRYRIVWDGPLRNNLGWNVRGDVVSPQNRYFDLPAGTTSIPVTEISVHVYLATDVVGGTGEFEGEVFFDEIGWR